MGDTIVMQQTIDYLVQNKRMSELDNMMGSSSDWEKCIMEDKTVYYKKIIW